MDRVINRGAHMIAPSVLHDLGRLVLIYLLIRYHEPSMFFFFPFFSNWHFEICFFTR